MSKVQLIQVDDCGDGVVYVRKVYADGEPSDDVGFDTRRAAQRYADKLARQYGCDWESNYPPSPM